MDKSHRNDDEKESTSETSIDRRTFLKWGGYGAAFTVLGPALAACGEDAVTATTAATTTSAASTTAATTSATTGATTATTAATTTTAAATGPIAGGTIRLGMDSTIRNFDYHKIGSLSDSWPTSQIFRGLSDLDPLTFGHVPEQALSWSANDDFTVWTFKIRPGILFHNGREMTAEDVKFSTDRVLDPETASFYIRRFDSMESVEVTDSETLVVTFSAPTPRAEELFFTHVNAIMPSEAIENMNTDPVGSGPYRLKEHRPGEVTILERNTDYWEDGLPYLDEIHMIPIEDETSRLAALRAGEVDWIRNPPRAEIESLQADESLNVQVLPSSWVDYFKMNIDKPPLDNLNVRLAIAMAIDRDAANQRALFGLGAPAFTLVPPLSNVPLDINPPPYDPDAARALIEQEGVVGFDLELMAHDVAHIGALAESVAADLQAIGINAVAAPTEDGLWIERWVDRDWQMASSAGISFIDPEPRSAGIASETDNTGYRDPDITALLAQGAALSDTAERSVIYSEAWNKYLNEGATTVALTAAPYAVAMSNAVQGFPMFPEQQQRWEGAWLAPMA